MYSIVMMAALTASADQPSFGHKSCQGCSGYSCSGYASCYGSCSGSCYGSCSGGGKGGGGFLGLRGGKKGGSCHGCSGYTSCCGCTGYTACYGGCTGYGYAGGCTGYSYAGGCTGYSYAGGCVGYGAGCWGGAPVMTAPIMPTPETTTKPEEKKKKPSGEGETLAPAPATIVVSLPADAKLLVDGKATTSTTATRRLATPELEPNKVFTYTLTAEVTRAGKTLTASEKVTVQAGKETVVTLEPKAVETVAAR